MCSSIIFAKIIRSLFERKCTATPTGSSVVAPEGPTMIQPPNYNKKLPRELLREAIRGPSSIARTAHKGFLETTQSTANTRFCACSLKCQNSTSGKIVPLP